MAVLNSNLASPSEIKDSTRIIHADYMTTARSMLACEFRTAREAYENGGIMLKCTTGSDILDSLIGGGIELGRLYLFYGERESGVDALIHMILVNALLPPEMGGLGGKTVYLNCGNYKYERTMLNTEFLCSLIKAAGFNPGDMLSRTYAIFAFSEEQEERALDEIRRLLQADPSIRLLVVHNIANLFTAKEGTPNRNVAERIVRLQRIIHEIWRICMEKNVAFIASCRPAESRRGRIPPPKGGRYLSHRAAVIVYLEKKSKGDVSAYLIKHPSRAPKSARLIIGGEGLGRVTFPFRSLLKDEIGRLRRTYREALLDLKRREAFDSLVRAWSSELGAMSNASVPTVLEVMLLTAAVDNRKNIEEIIDKVEKISLKLREIELRLREIKRLTEAFSDA